jgi:hypothetical protein
MAIWADPRSEERAEKTGAASTLGHERSRTEGVIRDSRPRTVRLTVGALWIAVHPASDGHAERDLLAALRQCRRPVRRVL